MTSKIKYDMNTMKIMSTFQALTKTTLKDCYSDENTIVFIVNEGQLGQAIGKNASNVKRLASAFNKKIKIVEFNDDMLKFIKNLVQPLQIAAIEENEGVVTLSASDMQTRGYLIGRGGSALRQLEERVKRHFDIKEIKVL